MDKRSFPRYDIHKLSAYLILDEMPEHRIPITNISLGGLQLSITERIDITKEQEATFYLGERFIRRLRIKEVWCNNRKSTNSEKENNKKTEIKYQLGLRLFFNELESFERWRMLMIAFQKIELKKKMNA